jgi:hypothetical protein
LLLMFNVPTVAKLIPSRVLKKVLVMSTLSAIVTGPEKVSWGRAGSAVHEIEPTVVKSVNARVERRVRLFSRNCSPMVPIEELPRLVNWPAFSQIRLPVICSGPSMLIVPAAVGLMRTSPVIVKHEANRVASACELMVAVG